MIEAYNLRFGVNCKQNLKKSEEYCLLACSEGSKLALGMKHLFGWKTEKDEKKAFELFNQIAEEWNEKNEELRCSLFLIARSYNNGYGIERNIQKAVEYYEKASFLDDSNSMYNLAIIYKSGDTNFEIQRDIKKAADLYERAIELGDIDSLNNLANIYKIGYPNFRVQKNIKRAIELYLKAIEMGDSEALNNLANLYRFGDSEQGIEPDINKAIELYEQAVNVRNINAMYNLSLVYTNEENKYVRDINRAFYLLFQIYLVDQDNKSKDRLINIINDSQSEIVWRQEYHIYWNKESNLNQNNLPSFDFKTQKRNEEQNINKRSFCERNNSQNCQIPLSLFHC